jgi:hypothetical protein
MSLYQVSKKILSKDQLKVLFESGLPSEPEKRTIDQVLNERHLSLGKSYHNISLSNSDNKLRGTQDPTDALINIQSPNILNSAFFSKENIDLLQDQIRYTVYQHTKTVIGNQSVQELVVVMRSIYLQFAGALETSTDKNIQIDLVKTKIKKLNDAVLNYVIPNVRSNLSQYMTYLDSLNNPLQKAMDNNPRSENVNIYGTKTLHESEVLFRF